MYTFWAILLTTLFLLLYNKSRQKPVDLIKVFAMLDRFCVYFIVNKKVK